MLRSKKNKIQNTYCKHDFDKCFCAFNPNTVLFLNDVYCADVLRKLNTWLSTRKMTIIAIMKVFSNDYIAGDIIVRDANNAGVKQGTWHRIKPDNIVFCPNTMNTDTERAYVHENLFPELYNNNTVDAYGYRVEVLHRDSFGACATVIVKMTWNKSQQRLTGGKFNYTKNAVAYGTFDTKTAHGFYECGHKPIASTEMYTHEAWIKSQLRKSSNGITDNLHELFIDLGADAHGHICDHCTLPYVHVHRIGVNNAQDRHSLFAKHNQFEFDCPYSTCTNYNHVDCLDDCTLPQHKNARLKLEFHVKNSYRLSIKAINDFYGSMQEANAAGIKIEPIPGIPIVIPSQPESQSNPAIIVTPDGIPPQQPGANNEPEAEVEILPGIFLPPSKHLTKCRPNMNAAGNSVPRGQYLDVNPVTKQTEAYICYGDDITGTQLAVITGNFDDVNHFTYDGGEFCITCKAFNRLVNNALNCTKTVDVLRIVTRNFLNIANNAPTMSAIAVIHEQILTRIVHIRALETHLLNSKLGKLTDAALTQNFLPHGNFMYNWRKLGLRRSIHIWVRGLIPARVFCCNTDVSTMNELRLFDNRRTMSPENNGLLL